MLNVHVQDGPRELRAAVLAMRRADKDVRTDISQRLRSVMSPEWATLLPQFLTGIPQERMLVTGARIAPGNPPQIVAAGSTRKMGRALVPSSMWPMFEYGAGGHEPRTYDRRNLVAAGRHKVTRDTRAGLPAFRKMGRVIGPAVVRFLPRVCAFWVQSVIKAFMDAAESRN